MSLAPSLVSVSGNVHRPSRTAALVAAVQSAVASRIGAEGLLLELAEIAHAVLPALTREALSADGEAIVRRIELADVLVFGSPIYRATYTGAAKHLFDMVDYRALRGLVVIPVATARQPGHALALEHQFRPLFGFFGAVTTPTAIFATEADFDGTTPIGAGVLQAIERAADEAARLLRAGLRVPPPLP